jgi:O-methyltransferase
VGDNRIGTEKTLLDDANLPVAISLLRLDTDWYESTKIELEILYPRLVLGGVLIIDDYGHFRGAQKAVDEFFTDQHIWLHRVDYTCRLMIKA